MLCDQLCCCKRIIVLYFENVIIDFGVQSLGHKSGTDTLNLVRTGLSAGEHRRICRFYGNDFHIRILGLQIFTGTADSTAGADTGMEELNFFDEDEDTDDYEELENVNSEEIVFETLDTAGDADEE